jgi:HAD superfamily hydrolase (TIGR01459 family)
MPAAPAASSFAWDALPERYRVILCDIWGVVHDGMRLNPGAAARLHQWREQGRFVVLITNAPRTADAVQGQLDGLGLPRSCRDAIVTSGEAGIEALNALDEPVGFIGTQGDRSVLEGRHVRIATADDFSDLACTGLQDDRPDPERYRAELARLVQRHVRLHCLNPDRLVVHGSVAEACAGALADLYEELGGAVVWYGKPHASIYRHALHLAGEPSLNEVLAVGDGLLTDMLGAARLGVDAVFISGGIHAGEPFPPDFGAAHGVSAWKPIGVVEGLG